MLQLKLKRVWQQKGLGQHFLTDPEILNCIADAAVQGDEATRARTLAVEIGPGPGTLTTLLAERANAVVAVEYDERLRELHRESFGQAPHVHFVYGDALK